MIGTEAMNQNTKVLYKDTFLTVAATQHKKDVIVHTSTKTVTGSHTSTLAVIPQAIIIGAKSLGYKILPLKLKR